MAESWDGSLKGTNMEGMSPTEIDRYTKVFNESQRNKRTGVAPGRTTEQQIQAAKIEKAMSEQLNKNIQISQNGTEQYKAQKQEEAIKKKKAKEDAAKEGKTDNSKTYLTDYVIGMPPHTHISDNVMINSMPMMEITPCEANVQMGMTIYKADAIAGMKNFREMLGKNGYHIPESATTIKVVYIADSFPTDTFTNEYAESFLQGFGDTASEAALQLNQFTGQNNLLQSVQKGMDLASGPLEGPAGMIGRAAGGMDRWIEGLKNSDDSFRQSLGKSLGVVLSGSRLDFPQIWKNSSYSPSYSITVRLYNPNPSSDASTRKYIVAPLAVLLCLGLPRSLDNFSYKWPFIHKIKCPGIFNLNPAYISNIAVVKGGDSQSIAYNQRMGIVDVRIDFGSIYNSIIAGESSDVENDRPNLSNYLNSFMEKKDLLANVSLFEQNILAQLDNYDDTEQADNNTLIAGNPGSYDEPAPASRYDSLDADAEKKATPQSSFYNDTSAIA